ncbi:MAG: hypothetical protein FH749_06525 [Firmicutes bacterium]|nr:hypothetical protein [Bacillota bacterium]
MKKILPAILVLFLLTACSNPSPPSAAPDRPVIINLWDSTAKGEYPAELDISQEAGDLIIEDFGEPLAVYELPEHENQFLVLDNNQGVVGFHVLDVRARTIETIDALTFAGVTPQQFSFAWPRLLLQASDGGGNSNWALAEIDTGLDQVEIVWQDNAWVPETLRRRPIWEYGGNWYLAPVTGPRLTQIPDAEVVARLEDTACAVSGEWPAWMGAVTNSPYFVYPTSGEEAALLNLTTGEKQVMPLFQDLRWNQERSRYAWRQDDTIGHSTPGAAQEQLELEGIAGSLLWASDWDILYFIGGQRDYFGATWDTLWIWNEDAGLQPVLELPENRERWRLLAATSQSVLAASGNDQLWYFDLDSSVVHDLSGIEPGNWRWQEGFLIGGRADELVRITPGAGLRVIERNGAYRIYSLLDNYIVFGLEGQVRVRQLAN